MKDDRKLRVLTPPQFAFLSTVLSHGWYQLAPFRLDRGGHALSRLHRLADGTLLQLTVTGVPREGLLIELEGHRTELGARQRQEIAAAVRRVFQLDLDLTEFYEFTRRMDRYRWIERDGAGRLLRSPSVWEDLAKTLLTTNTNWASTRSMVRRLTGLAGQSLEGDHPFPTAAEVAALDPMALAQAVRAGYRSEYLHELAVRIAKGELKVETWDDPSIESKELFERVRSLRGFGPYAAGTLLKLLGHFDRLALDTATRSMFARVYNGGEPAEDDVIRRHYRRYGRWAGLLLWLDLVHDHGQ